MVPPNLIIDEEFVVLCFFSDLASLICPSLLSAGLKYISSNGVVTNSEYALSKNALHWAAMTYVVAALSSLATLLYYASLLSGRRND
jgi:hypothetical protein